LSIRKNFLLFAKDAGVYGLGNILNAITSFIMLPLYLNYLTPAYYGIISIATALRNIMFMMCKMGLDKGYRRFYFDCNSDEERKRLFSTLVFSLIIFNTIVLILLWFYGDIIFSLLIKDIPFHPYIWLVALTIFFNIPYHMQLRRFLTINNAKRYVQLSYTIFFLNISLIVLFIAVFKEGAIGKLKADLIAMVIASVSCVFWLRRDLKFTFNIGELKSVLKFSTPLVPAGMSNWVLKLSDRLFIAHYLTANAVGLYSLGYKLASIIEIVIMSIQTAILSRFYYLSKNNRDEAVNVFSKLNTYILLIAVTLAFILSIFSKELIWLLTSNIDYLESANIIPLISTGLLFWAAWIIPCATLSYTKDTHIISKVLITMSLISMGSNIILIPRFGMYGAAYSTIITYFLRYIWIYFEAQKKYRMDYEIIKIFYLLSIFFILIGCDYIIATEGLLHDLIKKITLLVFYAFFVLQVILSKDIQVKKEIVTIINVFKNKRLK